MLQNKKKIVNLSLIIMGIVGYLVMLLPWYELTSSSYLSGFGSSSMNGGKQIGFVAAGSSIFGYALYLIPGVLIAMGLKSGNYPTRAKALILEYGGLAELICLVIANLQMQDYGTSISGSGYSAKAGFEPQSGYTIALIVYLITGILGFVMCFVAPKPQAEEAAAAESKPQEEVAAVANAEDKPEE